MVTKVLTSCNPRVLIFINLLLIIKRFDILVPFLDFSSDDSCLRLELTQAEIDKSKSPENIIPDIGNGG